MKKILSFLLLLLLALFFFNPIYIVMEKIFSPKNSPASFQIFYADFFLVVSAFFLAYSFSVLFTKSLFSKKSPKWEITINEEEHPKISQIIEPVVLEKIENPLDQKKHYKKQRKG